MGPTVNDETEECIHGLIPETCTICRHPYRPPEPESADRAMAAKYDGVCPACHETIKVGDLIVHVVPSDRWVCSDCGPT
jgi:hypothetical protein